MNLFDSAFIDRVYRVAYRATRYDCIFLLTNHTDWWSKWQTPATDNGYITSSFIMALFKFTERWKNWTIKMLIIAVFKLDKCYCNYISGTTFQHISVYIYIFIEVSKKLLSLCNSIKTHLKSLWSVGKISLYIL